MYKIYLILVATMLLIPLLSKADDEVIWETEQINGLNTVVVSPLGNVLYNSNDSIIEVRNIEDGKLIDQMIFPNTTRLNNLSITADGRYMAISGKTKFVIIYDLFERKEVKRITTEVYARKELKDSLVVYKAENWISSSISPDGTKITGVATADGGNMSNFVVIDIASEKTIFEQRRIGYDLYHPINQGFDWKSAEYTPDGKYVVAQLDYGDINGPGPDTVYVYDANTFEIYDKVLNNYAPGNGAYNEISFSSFENVFSTSSGKELIIYNLDTKLKIVRKLSDNSNNITFSRLDKKIALQIGLTAPVIYDYDLGVILSKIGYLGLPKITTLNNNLLYIGIKNNIALIKPNWDSILNIDDKSNYNTLSPNPSTGILNISINNKFPSIFRYDIISDSGQSILSDDIGFLQPNNNKVNINISSIPIGHYILRISSEREEFTFNIIKEN